MRRFKQELSHEETLSILKTGKVAVMAVEGNDGYPYAVPLNYVYDDGSVYIHCAKEGHKIDALNRNPLCSLCIIDKDDIVPHEFTSYFRSAIVFGKAEFIKDEKEKTSALKKLCDKYSPGIDSTAEIEKSLQRVCIIRIKIDRSSGKEAIELTRHRCHPKQS